MNSHTIKIEYSNFKLIISYVNIFCIFLSIMYSLLLISTYLHPVDWNTKKELLPLIFSLIIPTLFMVSYILNMNNRPNISKVILINTLLGINFYSGYKWGFDLPSVLMSYILCIVIMSLTSRPREVYLYLTIMISSIVIGNYLRDQVGNKLTWYGTGFYINDIIEFSVIFIFIAFVLIKFNLEQNRILNRSIRSENLLRRERDNLEKLVKQKTKEIKQIQMEELSKIYHLIEFSKLSSGLFHDLMTPIQTMNLYMEKLTNENIINDSKFSKIIFNMKNSHDRLTLMIQNIRKQINFKNINEKTDLVMEIKDLIELVKNNYLKNEVLIDYKPLNEIHILNTNKSILNHILLNLISNSYEACIQDRKINKKDSYTISIISGKHKTKNFISVIDNGTGIKNENLSKIFDDFYSSKGKNNCGIGLSSARYFLEKYLNGKILIESENGNGTTMTMVF